MASGNPVVEVLRVMQPTTLYALHDVRIGGSTPAEGVAVYSFDAAATWYLDFLCRLSEGYAGGGLTLTLPYSMASATTGGVRLEAAVRRMADDAEDIDTSQTYDFNGVTDTVASASGELSYPQITFTHGSDMDSWAVGELAIVRVRRKHDDAGDDATGAAQLWDITGKET